MPKRSVLNVVESFRIGVLPHKAIVGASSLEDLTNQKLKSAICSMTLPEALELEYPEDAHLLCYSVEDEDYWPRLNKGIVRPLLEAGGSLVCNFWCFDFDCPGHAEITMAWLTEFLTAVDNIEDSVLSDWYCIYTTLHGARIVYLFDEPVGILEIESYVFAMYSEFLRHKMEPDDNALEWNRLFRMPKVKRDDHRTEEHELFVMDFKDVTCDVFSLTPLDKDRGRSMLKRRRALSSAEVPSMEGLDIQESLRLLEVFSGSSHRKTEWYKYAKKRMHNRECFDVLFNEVVLADPGERDSKLLEYVGSTISMLYGQMGTTPQHIFALFYDPVSQFEQDEDWQRNLWSKVCRMWEQEASDQDRKEEQRDQIAMSYNEKVDAMCSGMLEWCEHPDLKGTLFQKERFVRRHSLALCGGLSFLLKSDGLFENTGWPASSIVPRIQIAGMDDVVQVYAETERGTKKRSAIEVTSDHATPVDAVEYVPEIKGGYIQNMDSQTPVLRLCAYRRSTKLVPEYSPLVDEWLMMLTGNKYPIVCQWISFALAFEEGNICALSLHGGSGVGKCMIVQGLAECLERPLVANAEEIVGNFNESLRKTPFINVDEGWPANKAFDISNQFRSLVANGSFMVNEKFKARIKVFNPVRIVITANEESVLHEITDGKDLSPHSRDALATRLLNVEVSPNAARWLRDKGGRSFTGAIGSRWISGATGVSDYVVARHFLYLYHTRDQYNRGSRFLVDGALEQADLQDMLTKSGFTPLVLECILNMVELKDKGGVDGLSIRGSRIYVTAHGVLSYFRLQMADKTRDDLNLLKIEKVLKSIRGADTSTVIMEGHERSGECKWYEIDSAILVRFSQSSGIQNRVLRKVLDR